MRIAVSGAIGTGKTTLGRALATRLDVVFIEENLDLLFEGGRFPADKPDLIADGLVRCLTRKHALEGNAGKFVVDRCPLDIMNFWQVARLPRECSRHDIIDLCSRYTAEYDFVVLTPWGSLPLSRHSADGVGRRRVIDPWIQFKGSAMIAGLACHFLAPEKIIQIPKETIPNEDRLAFVCAAIGA